MNMGTGGAAASSAGDGPPPLTAEPIELGYAHNRPGAGVGRSGDRVIVEKVGGSLQRRCVVTGDTYDEAAAAGTELLTLRRTLRWTPSWVSVMAVVGLLVFGPLLIAAVIVYFVIRKRVDVDYCIRRDIHGRRAGLKWTFALIGTVALSLGVVALVQTDNPLFIIGGLLVLIACLIVVAAASARSVRVKKVTDTHAELVGFGRGFLDRAEFDYQVPS